MNDETVGIDAAAHPFLHTRSVGFVPGAADSDALENVARHQIDMLVEFDEAPRYWINQDSPKDDLAERLLLQTDPNAVRRSSPVTPCATSTGWCRASSA